MQIADLIQRSEDLGWGRCFAPMSEQFGGHAVLFEMDEYAVCGVGIYFLGTESLTHRDTDRVRGRISPLFPPSPFLPRQ